MSTKQICHVLLTGACAMALAVGPLTACGGSSSSSSDATDEAAQSVEKEEATTEEQKTEEAEPAPEPEEVAPQQDEAPAEKVIDTGAFTFEVPDYWLGKVEVSVEDADYGPRATITLAGNADAVLATLELVEGDQAEIAGDIGSHLVGSISDGNGSHVEVWTRNWPWLAANESLENLGVSEDELATLVDLSTGGALTLADTSGDFNQMEEYEYTKQALASTVAFG